MREEEQLAHDVYTTLGQIWDVRIFENIASSERSHIDAALGVLDNFGIDDPAVGNELGTFTDPQIQALYDRLVSDGSTSLVAALEVGAFIEELDIADLRLRASATEVEALTTLYANLEKGSRNHLRAFTSQLECPRRRLRTHPTRRRRLPGDRVQPHRTRPRRLTPPGPDPVDDTSYHECRATRTDSRRRR